MLHPPQLQVIHEATFEAAMEEDAGAPVLADGLCRFLL